MYYFNDTSNGIFADGYEDKDGLPVGDCFAYLLRAKVYGTSGKDWTKDQLKIWIASMDSYELNKLYND